MILVIVLFTFLLPDPALQLRRSEMARAGMQKNAASGIISPLLNRGMQSLLSPSYAPDLQGRPGRIMVDKDYPLMGGSPHAICKRYGKDSGFSSLCQQDSDLDRYPKEMDCDDDDPAVNPSSREVPYDGVDSNCDIGDDPPLNIILIVLESVDADRMQVYGGKEENNPFLSTIINESLIAERMYANTGVSYRAELMMLCSIYPYEDYYGADLPSYNSLYCMHEILADRGYRAGYFTSGDLRFGGMQGILDEPEGFTRTVSIHDLKLQGMLRTGWGVEERALLDPFFDWADQSRKKPFFAVLRFSTGHPPIIVPKEFRRFPDQRDNAILYADVFTREVFRRLKERGLQNRTAIAIIGDHTERRFDYGRVPFILHAPRTSSGMRVEEPASQLDIAPTLLSQANIHSVNSFLGRDLERDGGVEPIMFIYQSGATGLLADGMLYRKDPNTGFESLRGEDGELHDKELKAEMADRLYGRRHLYKGFYQQGRLFDPEMAGRGQPRPEASSCWPLTESLSGIVWADGAKASSSYGNHSFSPQQATGPPDSPPCASSINAWAPQAGEQHEWLQVGFDKPARAAGLVICPANNPPFIATVELLDEQGRYHMIWSGIDRTECPGMFRLAFDPTGYAVAGVRINTKSHQMEQIDAVGLSLI